MLKVDISLQILVLHSHSFMLFQGCLEISVQTADRHFTGGMVDLRLVIYPIKCTQSLNAYNFGTVCPIYLL